MRSFKLFHIDSLAHQEIDEEADLIPLLTPEDEEEMNRESMPKTLPILPLRNTVLFPGVVTPIMAGRDTAITLLRDANNGNKTIGVVAQRDENVETPGLEDLNSVGTVARILRVLQMPDGNTTVVIQGKKRFGIRRLTATEPYLQAEVEEIPEQRPELDDKEFNAIIESIRDIAVKIIRSNPNIPTEATFAIENIESNTFLINFVSSNLNLPVDEKQELLEISDLRERAMAALRYMDVEYQKLVLKNEVQSKVRNDLDKQQREYFLQQQMKTIQEELGGISYEEELDHMLQRAGEKKWSKKVGEHFEKEWTKMQRMNPQVAEYTIQRNYLELLLDLPWDDYSKDSFDLKKAQRILDRDHFGLEDVKKRIIEYLAVLKLRNDMKSPILCLHGPPGVGKTSLGKSIAEALGRKYVRMSLGGMRDEAEIRGHRKTYIGAMPGRIVQNLKKAEFSNPVFVLDEIDKLSSGVQGDPSSAMLEVLDPEQNKEFYDNFLEIGYDLSKVLFVATANNVGSIQPALRDRMELIEVSGYTTEEKVQIARKHLLPKQLRDHGLKPDQLKLSKAVLERIIQGYTRESGVRGLEKQIARVVRYAAKSIATEEPYLLKPGVGDLTDILGPVRVHPERYESNEVAGVVTGLAWTSVGGAILFIESILSRGKGGLNITGNLGKVMKESATIALEYIKAHAQTFDIDPEVFDKYNVHIHVPEGATPKDGPSAGIAMLTSLVSLFTQRKVKKHLAMTGEITLRGRVLPVGGIKEKILAAKRAGIKEIILCEDNRKDVEEIKPDYVKGLTFHYVREMHEVIALAILQRRVKNARTL